MEIDEPKKRKIEEEALEILDLENLLKAYIDNSQKIAKLLAFVTQKVLVFEKVFNKDIFKKD